MVPLIVIVQFPRFKSEFVCHITTLVRLLKVIIEVLPRPEVLTTIEYNMSVELQQIESYENSATVYEAKPDPRA